jgi:hypothetical protein
LALYSRKDKSIFHQEGNRVGDNQLKIWNRKTSNDGREQDRRETFQEKLTLSHGGYSLYCNPVALKSLLLLKIG